LDRSNNVSITQSSQDNSGCISKKSSAFLDTLLQLQEENPGSISDEEILSETNLFIAGVISDTNNRGNFKKIAFKMDSYFVTGL